MFYIKPVMQYKDTFSATLSNEKESLGGLGKDSEGIYINLNRELNIDEMIELLNVVKYSGENFDKINIKIQYIDSK